MAAKPSNRTVTRILADIEELGDVAEWFTANDMPANAKLVRRACRDLKKLTKES